MKIEIEVKPGTARRIAMIGATFVVLGVAAAVHANQVHFTNGQTLTATDLNNNFDELYGRTIATANGKSMTVNGLYCGVTTTTYTGDLGGYSGAKTKCEATCGAATAHMCSGDEVVRSSTLGTTLPAGWYSLGTYQGGATTLQDCHGFTDGVGVEAGPIWKPSYPGPSYDLCPNSQPILCCN